jgi:hypothetical protein
MRCASRSGGSGWEVAAAVGRGEERVEDDCNIDRRLKASRPRELVSAIDDNALLP